MKRFLLLLVLVTIFLISSTMTASAQYTQKNPCTSSNPCNQQICGNHVCAPGEYAQYMQAVAQAQRNNTTPSTTSGAPIAPSTTGSVIGGVMAYMSTASDGTTVIVRTAHPISGQALDLAIGFKNANGNFVLHQNYEITVTQDNGTVLSNSAGHTHSGIDTQITSVLSSNNPISIKLVLNGVGLPGTDPSTWTGSKGEVLSFGEVAPDMPAASIEATTSTPSINSTSSNSANNTVPEFGPIASVVLVIAIISIIAISARTKLGFSL